MLIRNRHGCDTASTFRYGPASPVHTSNLDFLHVCPSGVPHRADPAVESSQHSRVCTTPLHPVHSQHRWRCFDAPQKCRGGVLVLVGLINLLGFGHVCLALVTEPLLIFWRCDSQSDALPVKPLSRTFWSIASYHGSIFCAITYTVDLVGCILFLVPGVPSTSAVLPLRCEFRLSYFRTMTSLFSLWTFLSITFRACLLRWSMNNVNTPLGFGISLLQSVFGHLNLLLVFALSLCAIRIRIFSSAFTLSLCAIRIRICVHHYRGRLGVD